MHLFGMATMVIHQNNDAWSIKYSKNHLSLANILETLMNIFMETLWKQKEKVCQ